MSALAATLPELDREAAVFEFSERERHELSELVARHRQYLGPRSSSPPPIYIPGVPSDPVWPYDADMYGSGWRTTDTVGATYMMNAAYDDAMHWGYLVRRLNMCWHRDGEPDVEVYGHNKRGDIAPSPVHNIVDSLLQARDPPASLTPLELDGVHARIDLVWFRHSRSPERLPVALYALKFFDMKEIVRIHAVMQEECLTDFRQVMVCVDPRQRIEYGRTLTSMGIARRWRDTTWPTTSNWDSEGMAGSSSDERVPYSLSEVQEALQDERFAERRVARAKRQVRALNKRSDDLQSEIARLTERAAALSTVRDILRRGIRCVDDDRDREWTFSLESPQSDVADDSDAGTSNADDDSDAGTSNADDAGEAGDAGAAGAAGEAEEESDAGVESVESDGQ